MYLRIAYMMLVLLFFRCTNEHNHTDNAHDNDDHEKVQPADHADEEMHEHEEIKKQYTVYTDKYELFAESDPLIAGEEAEILAHFTVLPEFSPLEESSIEMELLLEGNVSIRVEGKPVQSGIFLFEVKPETPGKGWINYRITSSHATDDVSIEEVEIFDNHEAVYESSPENKINSVNTVPFTKEQSWKIDFATGNPVLEEFGQVIKTVAIVKPNQREEILLSALAPGIIDFSRRNLLEGGNVQKGEFLLNILSGNLAENNMNVTLQEARNDFEKARADYERIQDLADEKVVSQKELLAKKNAYENAKIRLENLERNFNNEGQVIKSPINGYVKQLFVENGQFATTGQTLMSIAGSNSLILHAEIQQKYFEAIKKFKSAYIRKMNESKVYTLEELNGELLSFGQIATQNSHLLPVDIGIENKYNFLPGSFVEMHIKASNDEKELTVPNSALLEEQGLYFVFVQVHPELFEKRQVYTGASDGMRTVIERGLLPDERIVTKGAMLVKLAQATGTLDAHSGHVH